MVRQLIPSTTPAGPKPLTALTVVTWTAADTVNLDQFTLTERQILLIWNTHATTTFTYTLTAVPDQQGRSVDIGPVNLAAGVMHACRPGLDGFGQPTTMQLFMTSNNAAIKYAVLNF